MGLFDVELPPDQGPAWHVTETTPNLVMLEPTRYQQLLAAETERDALRTEYVELVSALLARRDASLRALDMDKPDWLRGFLTSPVWQRARDAMIRLNPEDDASGADVIDR